MKYSISCHPDDVVLSAETENGKEAVTKAGVFAGTKENERGGEGRIPEISSFKRGRIKSASKSVIFSFSFLALLSACGVKPTPPLTEISVTLSPNTANVQVTQSLQLTATVHNATIQVVSWSISGAGCSGMTCGTISSTGVYTAPASVPSPATVTVKATSAVDTSKSASATITIMAAGEAAGEWTWVSGSSTMDQNGTYGTKGIAAPSNVPGARSAAVSWLDSSGSLWLFGGFGYDSAGNASDLNDLWKYDPATHEWTWVSGSNTVEQAGTYGTQGASSPSNIPGSRQRPVSWTDSSGKLWLFGGYGFDSVGDISLLNDLWRYDPATHEWTWVSGSNLVDQNGTYGIRGIADPSNIPGARYGAVSWLDSSGNLWLFGGVDARSGILNDLWKYNPVTLEWTWVSGSNFTGQMGTYGTQGTGAASNVPGARQYAVSWTDSSGKLWLFGGFGFDSAGRHDQLNDLWRYDPATFEWTWVSGSNITRQVGTYGTQGTAAPSNVPGARNGIISWTDSSGNLWLFGGVGFDSVGIETDLNDLWKYDPATHEWTWVSGSNIGGQLGTYGTQGTGAPSNVPGARGGPLSWIDSSGNFWLFGGADQAGDFLNDLWKYTR